MSSFIQKNKWLSIVILFLMGYSAYIPFMSDFEIVDIDTVIPSGEFLGNGMAYVLFLISLYLMITFTLLVRQHPAGIKMCKMFGVVSAVSVAAGVYFIYGPFKVVYLLSVAIWGIGWAYGYKIRYQ